MKHKQIRWYDPSKVKPKVNDLKESEYVLCLLGAQSVITTCWYDKIKDGFIRADIGSDNNPVWVKKWTYIDNFLQRIENA
jgi:hypothetical protein